jgi:hypothetical protein
MYLLHRLCAGVWLEAKDDDVSDAHDVRCGGGKGIDELVRDSKGCGLDGRGEL